MSFETAQWQAIDKLVAEQKLEAALTELAALHKAAAESGKHTDWTRALLREVQLRTALGGAETAVRQLREAEWPKDDFSQLLLELYYAGSLLEYLGHYGWEINRRERVESQGLELKLWTREQIVSEALRALSRVWQKREALSGPASLLGPYLKQLNNYPAGIRDTLRDVVSYHLVELLANTTYWRPAEQNDLFLLNHAALLSPGKEALALDDAAQHPLRRALAVLDDLQAWHDGHDRHDAALEARLERLRRLHAAFTGDAERTQQTAALEALLARSQKSAWWPMGQHLRAAWAREAGELRRAHELAQAGAAAQGHELAVAACRALIAELEAPSFDVQGMLVDGPARRSLSVQHKNLKQLHIRAYAGDLDARLERTRSYELLPDSRELRTLLEREKPVAEWSVSLPDLSDYDRHTTYVTPPLDKLGYYQLLISARPDFAAQDNRVLSVPFFVSRLALRHSAQPDGSLEVSVFDGDSGQPAAGVELAWYGVVWGSKPKRLTSVKSDARGLARLRPGNTRGVSSFVLARRGDDTLPVLGNIWVTQPERSADRTSSFVFTDRSVYRPNQSVHWKVLAFKGRDASWKNLTRHKLTVSLHDANGEQVHSAVVTTNAYGTAAGSFTIPAGRLLGSWSLRTSLDGSAELQVEEYKRPTFEVSVSPLSEAARLNHPVQLRGEAKYYFGLPVQSGQLRYRVERQERYPWWWWWRPPQRAPQVVGSGVAKVDAQGQFTIAFTPAADPAMKKGVQLNYRVLVDLTDEGGETRSASRDFVLGHVSIDARLELPVGFVVAGSGAEVSLARTNLDGDPRPGRGRYRVLELRQPARAVLPADRPRGPEAGDVGAKPRTAGDELRPRSDPQYDADAELASWLDGRELHAADIATNAQGKANLALPALPGGAYRIRYESQDEHGEKLEVAREFLVADAATKLALASVLKLERSSASAGVVRVLASSGLPDQPLWLEISQAGKLVERRWLAPGAPALQELTIGPAQRGGLSLALVGVRDYQPLEQSASLHVPWEDRQLKLELSTFRDVLRPGAKETFRVSVRGQADQTLVAAAELLAYMYDRSLDVFAPHVPPAPLSLYPDRSIAPRTFWSSTGSHAQWVFHEAWPRLPAAPELRGDALDFPSPYAYGGPGERRYRYAMGVSVARSRGAGGGIAEEGAMMPQAAMAAPAPAPMEADQSTGNAAKVGANTRQAAAPAPEVRSNFAETAFFLPNLLTDAQGSAAIEFTVPDSVTEWNVWLHAITRDFRSGSTTHKTRSVKDLLVRPYLPRFVREADEVALKVALQNASREPLSGELTFEIFDPATERSLAAEFAVQQTTLPFNVAAGASSSLTIPIRAPRRVGDVAVRVVGKAGAFSDGELRPLPLLPSRLHLVQSKFATLRGDGSQRSLRLPDLAADTDLSRTHEQLVVNVDAQLFMTVLKALPFLLEYPYECSEQTLNRFLSAGIVASVFAKHPAVKQMAADLSKQRDTLLDEFDAPDPNRTTQLEESPWLVQSRGGPDLDDRLIKVLDPEIAGRERDRALSRLQKMQLSSGAFPWFPGGPPSPYMTLYLLIGLARASEFDVALPRDMIVRAWRYVAEQHRADIAKHVQQGDASPEMITLLAFALSAFPGDAAIGEAFTGKERAELLEYAFARWTKLPPLLKSILSVSLLRAGRRADAASVFASVMDSAQTTEDEGTFWKPEDRGWLWYNDRIETHALALRTLLELDPKDPKLDGLVVWLLLNKKLNQWKSTRATAEVIYSLVKYLEKRSALGAREVVSVALGRAPAQELVFEPQQYRGKAQIVVPGPEVRGEMADLEVKKQGPGVAFASLTWHYATDELPAQGRGDLFEVQRSYFRREGMGAEAKLVPLAEGAKLQPGDEVEVQLQIKARAQAEYVHLRDPRAAGLEPPITTSRYHYDLGLVYYEEVRDSATNFFIEWLPAGEYTLKYRLRANLAGQFRVGPASLQSMYAPEFAAFSAGHRVRVQ